MFNDQIEPSPERLEQLYNLHAVCEAHLHDSPQAAEALFTEHVKQVFSVSQCSINTEEAMIMLNSLNRSLYDFYQFYFHASFAECCHKNRVNSYMRCLKTRDDVITVGIAILETYRKCYCAAQNECNHLERARNYIREHISDKLTLDSVSSAINISSSYLSRIFSAIAGKTFCEYIRDERIALACKLLCASNLSIDEVSERCGFSTPNYFSTVFKKCMGQAPAAYRAEVNA